MNEAYEFKAHRSTKIMGFEYLLSCPDVPMITVLMPLH
jgi:hypothetical protein